MGAAGQDADRTGLHRGAGRPAPANPWTPGERRSGAPRLCRHHHGPRSAAVVAGVIEPVRAAVGLALYFPVTSKAHPRP